MQAKTNVIYVDFEEAMLNRVLQGIDYSESKNQELLKPSPFSFPLITTWDKLCFGNT